MLRYVVQEIPVFIQEKPICSPYTEYNSVEYKYIIRTNRMSFGSLTQEVGVE